jgi:hypothetical protein
MHFRFPTWLLVSFVAASLCHCSGSDQPLGPELSDAGTQIQPSPSDAGDSDGSSSDGKTDATSNLEPLVIKPAQFIGPNLPLVMIKPGGPLQLVRPVQGGQVSMIGAQIANLRTDTIEIRTQLIDKDTQFIVSEEARTIVTEEVPDLAGWRQPVLESISQVSHLPLCPNYGSKAISGNPYDLKITITEIYVDSPQSETITIEVIPSCDSDSTQDTQRCICECDSNYKLGKCGPVAD